MSSVRHWPRRAHAGLVTAVAALMVLAPGSLASPAAAAADAGYFADFVSPYTVGGSGGPGKAVEFRLWIDGARDPRFEMDLTGLDGVLTATLVHDDCDMAGFLVTCDWTMGDGDPLVVPVVVHPVDGVEAGTTVELSWTTTAANVDTRTSVVTITIADGVDLIVLDQHTIVEGVEPGESVAFPVRGANLGNAATPDVLLKVSGTRLELGQYDNCSYSVEFDLPVAVCRLAIPGGLAPGEGFEVVGGFEITPNRETLLDFAFFTITPDDPVPSRMAAALRRGRGDTLAARKTRVSRSAPLPDIDESDNFGNVTLRVDNTADLVARGASAAGDAGDVVTLTVGVDNRGPAALEQRSGDPISRYRFVVPPGARVVSVPPRCFRPFPSNPNEPPDWDVPPAGLPEYWCYSGVVLEPGDEYRHTFRLRITEVIPDAAGSVEVIAFNGSPELSFDDNPANNTAPVIVNASLPVTGYRVGIVATAGAVLLALGVLVLLAIRRRFGPRVRKA